MQQPIWLSPVREPGSFLNSACCTNLVILVPSPNVAEDHQTKNALALVNKQAAIYVKDSEAETTLMDVALSTVNDEQKLKELTENIAKLALPDSARIIAQEVIKLAEAKNR